MQLEVDQLVEGGVQHLQHSGTELVELGSPYPRHSHQSGGITGVALGDGEHRGIGEDAVGRQSALASFTATPGKQGRVESFVDIGRAILMSTQLALGPGVQ